MQSVADSNSAGNRFSANELSSAEVQALLGFPHFKSIDRDAVIRAGSKIFHTSEKNVESWRQLAAGDSQNVFVCLLDHLGEWTDGLEIARTPNGGQQKQVNVKRLYQWCKAEGIGLMCFQPNDVQSVIMANFFCILIHEVVGVPQEDHAIVGHMKRGPSKDGQFEWECSEAHDPARGRHKLGELVHIIVLFPGTGPTEGKP